MKTIDQSAAVEIGKYYRVPGVITNKSVLGAKFGTFIPVLGPNHEDAEFINFPEPHWHIDWRFVSERFFSHNHWPQDDDNAWRVLGRPINVGNTTGDLILRTRRCKRVMPIMPAEHVPWLKKLEAAYAHCTLKEGLVCPHRGLPLQGCPVHNDIVVCPGHGLAWNVTTGKLVPGEKNLTTDEHG